MTYKYKSKQHIAVLSGVGAWAGIGLAVGLTDPNAGLGAVSDYAALSQYTNLGEQITVFALIRPPVSGPPLVWPAGQDEDGRMGTKRHKPEDVIAKLRQVDVLVSQRQSVGDADYLGVWLDVLRADDRAIIRAASAASKAADYLLAFRDREGGPAAERGWRERRPRCLAFTPESERCRGG